MDHLEFNQIQWLWLLVCLQLTLFGVGWAAASRGFADFRSAMVHISIFNAANAIALMLVSLRGQWPPILTDTVADVLVLLGFAYLISGSFHLICARPNRTIANPPEQFQPWVTFIGGMLAIFAFSVVWDLPQLRVLSLVVCIALVCIRGGWHCFKLLSSEGFTGAARGIFATGSAIGAGLLIHAVVSIFNHTTITFDQVSASTLALPFLLVAGIFAVNLLFAFTVTGKVVQELKIQSRRDALTGLPNRRAAMELLQAKWTDYKQHGEALSVVTLDVDHFKRINDEFGHAAGDDVLCAVAIHMAACVREQDLIARTGGEEFCAIFPGTPLRVAAQIAERLCDSVNQATTLHPQPGQRISISAGAACADEQDGRLDDLLMRADQAMYGAKQAGRNQLTVHQKYTINPQTADSSPEASAAIH